MVWFSSDYNTILQDVQKLFSVTFVKDNFSCGIELGFKRLTVVLALFVSCVLLANLLHPVVTFSCIC